MIVAVALFRTLVSKCNDYLVPRHLRAFTILSAVPSKLAPVCQFGSFTNESGAEKVVMQVAVQ
jgi:hypothetical protein